MGHCVYVCVSTCVCWMVVLCDEKRDQYFEGKEFLFWWEIEDIFQSIFSSNREREPHACTHTHTRIGPHFPTHTYTQVHRDLRPPKHTHHIVISTFLIYHISSFHLLHGPSPAMLDYYWSDPLILKCNLQTRDHDLTVLVLQSFCGPKDQHAKSGRNFWATLTNMVKMMMIWIFCLPLKSVGEGGLWGGWKPTYFPAH